jgi:hypothetical protein
VAAAASRRHQDGGSDDAVLEDLISAEKYGFQ